MLIACTKKLNFIHLHNEIKQRYSQSEQKIPYITDYSTGY